MLSSDVLALAKNYYTNELLAGQTLLGENPVEYDELGDWSRWITRNERIVESKKWYEMTLSDLKYRISPP
jgi:Txe/YoeB family toxin of Txe-Axe toxin-antitoxin module